MNLSLDKKIWFCNETPLVQRDYERFGFETFLSRGFEVSFLDLTRVLHPDYLANYDPPLKNYDGVVAARNEQDVLNFVEQNHKALAIVLLGYNRRTRFLYSAFRKYNIQYVQCESLAYGSGGEDVNLAEKLSRLWVEAEKSCWGFFKSVIRKLCRRSVLSLGRFVPAHLTGVQPPRYSLRAARKALQIGPKLGWNSEVVWLHHLDYDLYLKLREQDHSEWESPYGVFLDEYFPFHPDFFVYGYPPLQIDADKYHDGLNRFFDFIEEKMNMPVIIAAHPRARYDQRPDYFRGRKVEQFKTIELVCQAKIVLAHMSTSVNFAVMFRKPVICFTCGEIEEKTVYGRELSNSAARLGKKPINVDHDIKCDLDKECVVDEEKYRQYFIDYIKVPGTPEKPSWEVVADKIERDYFC